MTPEERKAWEEMLSDMVNPQPDPFSLYALCLAADALIRDLEAKVCGMENALVKLMKSSDASWYDGKHGRHDWREAVDAAHMALVKYGRKESL